MLKLLILSLCLLRLASSYFSSVATRLCQSATCLAPIDADFEMRFRNVGNLYGIGSLQRIRDSHVCVIGLGGVGSWAVEALARSGVSRFTLVDLDDICVSNINRQLQAVTSTVGTFSWQ